MATSRVLIAVAASALVAAVGYAYWGRGERDSGHRYITETLQRGAIVSTVTATGTVNPVTTVQVGTYVSGPVSALDVDYNSKVKKGQRVAKIDPAPFQVKVAEAAANLANARAKVDKDRADLELKRLTLDRNRELNGRNLIAQNDLDTAKSNYDQAVAQLALDQAGVKQADASLEEARINLAYTDITSPVDGVVVSRSVDVGQTVAASFQTPTLFLIAQDLTKMQVDSSVSESDIGGVRVGQPVSFTVDAYPGKPFHGSVVQVRNSPTTVQNVVTYDVVAAVNNSELALKPGMTATVSITTARRDNVLRIPLRALRFRPDGGREPTRPADNRPRAQSGDTSTVFVIQPDSHPQRVAVTTAARDEQYAEYVESPSGGLHEGDQVAVGTHRAAPQPTTGSRPPGLGGMRRF